MDGHEYITGKLVEARIADLRAAAARERLISTLREPRRPLRAVLGSALIRLGSRIVGTGATAQAAEKGPSASLAPSAARSTYTEYASRAAVGRRLAS